MYRVYLEKEIGDKQMTKDSYWNYHVKQYEEMYRSTLSIINFLKFKIPNENISVLDVGCGGGADIHWLKKFYPNWNFVGIDMDNKAINLAKEMNKREKDIRFEEMDFLKIENFFPAKSFDYVFAIQFISFVDFDFPIFLKKAFYLARKGVFLTSLFSDGWIEQHTMAYDLEENWNGLYKIYSLERFKRTINEIAGKDVYLEVEQFNIDKDLQKPDKSKFGTYTVKTEDENRLQISGYMLMPWYNYFIRFN